MRQAGLFLTNNLREADPYRLAAMHCAADERGRTRIRNQRTDRTPEPVLPPRLFSILPLPIRVHPWSSVVICG